MGRKGVIGVVVAVILFGGVFFWGATQLHENGTLTDDTINTMGNLQLTSSAFEHEGMIPSKYTCDGEDVSPPLSIRGVPEETQSLVLIMDDPDAIKPAGKVWDHWVVWNIPAGVDSVAENEEPAGVQGTGSNGKTGYHGPCPPDAEHRYFFKLYALDTELSLAEGATKQDVLDRMAGHVLDEAELRVRYERQ